MSVLVCLISGGGDDTRLLVVELEIPSAPTVPSNILEPQFQVYRGYLVSAPLSALLGNQTFRFILLWILN